MQTFTNAAFLRGKDEGKRSLPGGGELTHERIGNTAGKHTADKAGGKQQRHGLSGTRGLFSRKLRLTPNRMVFAERGAVALVSERTLKWSRCGCHRWKAAFLERRLWGKGVNLGAFSGSLSTWQTDVHL